MKCGTITSSGVITPDGATLEVYSASGERKTILKQSDHTGTVMRVRPLRWYEVAWYHTKKIFNQFRLFFRRPKLIGDWQSNVTVGYDPKTREIIYSSPKKTVRYPI